MKPTTILPKAIIAASCAIPLLLTACASRHEPEVVAANNPSITYHYRGDRELLQANQNAVTYCSQYKALPRTTHITRDDDERTVVFECVPANSFAETQFNPNTPYAYRSDEELIDNSRSAARYCRAHGQNAVSSITTAPDGTRTVTYQCVMP
jgi:hypothetical protein